MLLVVLGAGASFDSADRRTVSIGPPPLAKELVATRFNSIAAQYPLSRPIIDRLRSRMGEDEARSLETELSALFAQSANRPERREQLMVFRFYLQDLIEKTTSAWLGAHAGFTCYLRLLNGLYDGRETIGPVRFATFNYDLLLEAAIEDFLGVKFRGLNDYVRRADFQIFKLHGSVNWSQAFFTPALSGAEDMQQFATTVAGERPDLGKGELVMNEERPLDTDFGELRIPAIAVPLADKTEFECPDRHLMSLRNDLSKVDHVLVVGWRAAEAHAVEMLDSINPGFTLAIVSGSKQDCQEVVDNLGPVALKASRVRRFTMGFNAFASDIDPYLSALGPR